MALYCSDSDSPCCNGSNSCDSECCPAQHVLHSQQGSGWDFELGGGGGGGGGEREMLRSVALTSLIPT